MSLGVVVFLISFAFPIHTWKEMNLTLAEPNDDHVRMRFYNQPIGNVLPQASKTSDIPMVHLLRLLGICLASVNIIFIQTLWLRLFTEDGQREDWEDFLEENTEGFHLTDHAEKIKEAVMENLDNPENNDQHNTVMEILHPAPHLSVYEPVTIKMLGPRRKNTATVMRSMERTTPDDKKPMKKTETKNNTQPHKVDKTLEEPAKEEKEKSDRSKIRNDTQMPDLTMGSLKQKTKLTTEESVTAEQGEFSVEQTSARKKEKLQKSQRLPRAPKGYQQDYLNEMEDFMNDPDLANELENDFEKFASREKHEKR